MEDPNSDLHFRFENNPLYKKAWHISELVERVAEIVHKESVDQPEEYQKDLWNSYANFLREDAVIMTAKVAGAVHADMYDILMENATIIRKSAKDILLHLTGLEIHGFKDIEYLDVVRQELDAFRLLFAEWVKTFDPCDYYIDRWGLFNPPGVEYDDPEEDMPFTNPFDELFDEEEWEDFINPDEWDDLDEEDEEEDL
ncbi:MAG: hypothetical protein H0X63_11005 [Flavobacteriales bacterium]|nr:hypothetical protein [Flavobacteriales bacterium]